MSSRGVNEPERKSGDDRSARGLYVYCIAEREATASLLETSVPGAIERGAELETVVHDDLVAVVSAVPLSDYGEEALEARLADATWTALRAMRHEKVVEHFARGTSVVPLRFGAIYLEREGIERMLMERASGLRAIIERLRGKEEWGVNLFCDRAKLREKITSLSPKLLELSDRAAEASPGKAYLLKKEIEALRETETRAEIKRVGRTIEQDLAGHADAAVNLRVLKDEAAEHGDLVTKLALLITRSEFKKFHAAAERLADKQSATGFRLELTGPWPAYNFASIG